MEKINDTYVQVNLNASALKRLLTSQALYLEEVRMTDSHSQQLIKRLLADSVSGLS